MAEEKKEQAEEKQAEAEAEVKAEAQEKQAEAKAEEKQAEAEAKPKAEKPEKKAKAEKPKAEGKPQKGKGDKAKKEGKGEKGKEAEKAAKKAVRPKGPAELWLKYKDQCIPALRDEFKYKNVMEVPKLSKIVVNTCIKDALVDVKILETAAEEIAQITGQRPMITKAKKSIANFKLRQGQSIGASVTLRGRNMYEFMSRLVNVALPRVRDFKGVPAKSFDGAGNYTMGVTEQAIFPEINVDKVARTTGMNITFVTTAKTDEEGKALLKLLGMPFRNQ